MNTADKSVHPHNRHIEVVAVANDECEPGSKSDASAAIRMAQVEVAPPIEARGRQSPGEPNHTISATTGNSATEIQRGTIPEPPRTAERAPAHGAASEAVEISSSYPQVVHNARLVQQIGGSEWRVGLQTPEFGRIEIKTNTREGSAQAQLTVEHAEVHRIFAASEAELGNALARHNVEFSGTTLMHSSSNGGGGEQKQAWHAPQHQANPPSRAPDQPASSDLQAPRQVRAAYSGSSLNVLA